MIRKISLITTIVAGVTGVLSAQEISRSVIAADGGSIVTEDIQLDWTLGQMENETVAIQKTVITQGFQQPTIQVTRMGPVIDDDSGWTFKVYPNPVSTQVQLQPIGQGNIEYTATLLDASGKAIQALQSMTAESIQTMDVSALPSGSYFISIRMDGELPMTYQITKIQ